jgi:hypothetical protein
MHQAANGNTRTEDSYQYKSQRQSHPLEGHGQWLNLLNRQGKLLNVRLSQKSAESEAHQKPKAKSKKNAPNLLYPLGLPHPHLVLDSYIW